jgi:hypothetical protein
VPTADELAAQLRDLADEVAALGDGPPTDPTPEPDPQPTPDPAPKPTPAAPAKPTGLACVITADGRPQLSWDAAAGVTAWEVHDLANTAKTLQSTVTEPRSVRSALKPGQQRRYAIIAIGPGGKSEMSDSIDVPPAASDSPTPVPGAGARYPADVTGTNWYLTLPTGKPGNPDTVKMPAFATYSSKYLELTAAGDGAVFRVWHGGVTTSGSPNPRSELRECNADGSLAWWPLKTGKHSMTVVGQVNRLTKVRPHVVLHQVHDRGDDTTVWRLEGTNLWITDGDNTHAYLVTDGLAVGARYTLTTELDGGIIRYRFNGDLLPFTLPPRDGEAYFKAGAYAQTNPKSAPTEVTTEWDEVVVFAVTVTHSA